MIQHVLSTLAPSFLDIVGIDCGKTTERSILLVFCVYFIVMQREIDMRTAAVDKGKLFLARTTTRKNKEKLRFSFKVENGTFTSHANNKSIHYNHFVGRLDDLVSS